MKKMIFASCLALVLLLAGCQHGVVIDEVSQTDLDHVGERVGHTQEDKAPGSEIWVQTLTFTAGEDKGLQEINRQVEQITSQWITACMDNDAMMYEADTEAAFTHELTWSLAYGDENIISLRAEIYDNNRLAAHPLVMVQGYCFDHITGERLDLEHFLGEEPYGMISDTVIAQIRAEDAEDMYYPDYEELIPNNLDGDMWYADDAYIHLFFTPYSIAPYAAGVPEFTIPYK